MQSFSTHAPRCFAWACVLSVATIAALAGPSAASAERLARCIEGTPIHGEGSILQEFAQTKVWGEASPNAYNALQQTNAKACPGGPGVTYNGKAKDEASQGMENWYVHDEFGPEAQGFVGTDIPPTEAIKQKIDEQSEGYLLQNPPTKKDVLTIPTLQAAVAIVVHLPTGCTAEAAPGTLPNPTLKRLVLSQRELEKIYTHQVTKWSQIKEAGDKLVGCSGAAQSSPIIRVVREDGSGTTAIFKKWLELVNGHGESVDGHVCDSERETCPGKVCDSAGETWLECAEEPNGTATHNTRWPDEGTDLLRGYTDGGLVEKVEETPGSIGYAQLRLARAGKFRFKGFQPGDGGGEGTEEFWVELENGAKEGTRRIYVEPSTDGDVERKAKSNCEYTDYVSINPENGKAFKSFLLVSTAEGGWSLLSAEKKDPNYPLCGLSYDLALTDYHEYRLNGATEEEATTVGDYLEWVLNDEADGGQALIENETDYLGLPKKEGKEDVLRIAQEGAAKIDF
jgi:hypothetical protein